MLLPTKPILPSFFLFSPNLVFEKEVGTEKLSVSKQVGPPKKLRSVREKVVVEKQSLHDGKKMTARQVQVQANKANKRKLVRSPKVMINPLPQLLPKEKL